MTAPTPDEIAQHAVAWLTAALTNPATAGDVVIDSDIVVTGSTANVGRSYTLTLEGVEATVIAREYSYITSGYKTAYSSVYTMHAATVSEPGGDPVGVMTGSGPDELYRLAEEAYTARTTPARERLQQIIDRSSIKAPGPDAAEPEVSPPAGASYLRFD